MGEPRQGAALGEHRAVVVVGGGQAGLSMSHGLKQRGIDHVVLEKHRVGFEWRERRWDSFCLVTPNWQCRLPGFPYRGPEPSGFMGKDAIVDYVEQYARSFDAPVMEGVSATALRPAAEGGFELETTAGRVHVGELVVATGGYHIPQIPRLAERLPDDLVQLHSSQYRRPEALPPGAVLVIGSGQSGCQIAEDLHIAGRKVHLSVGGAPRTARRYAAATSSSGSSRWATTACRSTSTRSRSACAPRPTTTSPAATAGATSICASARRRGCACTAGSSRRAAGGCSSPTI